MAAGAILGLIAGGIRAATMDDTAEAIFGGLCPFGTLGIFAGIVVGTIFGRKAKKKLLQQAATKPE